MHFNFNSQNLLTCNKKPCASQVCTFPIDHFVEPTGLGNTEAIPESDCTMSCKDIPKTMRRYGFESFVLDRAIIMMMVSDATNEMRLAVAGPIVNDRV